MTLLGNNQLLNKIGEQEKTTLPGHIVLNLLICSRFRGHSFTFPCVLSYSNFLWFVFKAIHSQQNFDIKWITFLEKILHKIY